MDSLEQVQLLVHNSDVEVFTKIRHSLDELRHTISRLSNDVTADTVDLVAVASTFSSLTSDLQDNSKTGTVKEQYQTLMMNLDAHGVGLSFFKLKLGKSKEHVAARATVHKFFQVFTMDNKSIQSNLVEHLNIFTDQVTLSLDASKTLVAIFKDNLALCERLDSDEIAAILNALHTHGRSIETMTLLQLLVKPSGTCLNNVATMVIDSLGSAGCEDLLLLYHFEAGKMRFTRLMQEAMDAGPGSDDYNELQYHVALIKLLAICTEGKNLDTERTCQSFLPLDDVIAVVKHDDAPPYVKTAYLEFLNHCYLDVELHEMKLVDSPGMWTALDSFVKDIEFYFEVIEQINGAGLVSTSKELTEYIHVAVLSTVEYFVKLVLNSKSRDTAVTDERLEILWALLHQVVNLAAVNRGPVIVRTLKSLAQLGRRMDMKTLNPDLETAVQGVLTNTSSGKSPIKKKTSWANMIAKKRFTSNTFGSVAFAGMDQKQKEAKEIVKQLNTEVTKLEQNLQPFLEVERAILTKVLLHPHLVAHSKGSSHQQPFLTALIEHTKQLSSDTELDLQMSMLGAFQSMIHPTISSGHSQVLSKKLVEQFFDDIEDEGVSLHDDDSEGREALVQNLLDLCGCSHIVIDLMMTNKSNKINQEAMKLGIALLENGNRQIQESFFKRFQELETSDFFGNASSMIQMARLHITVQSDTESEVMERARNMFRLLQLLCEHHHTGLQNFVRHQHDNNVTYNLVQETLVFLDFYGLSLYICETNVGSIIQALETLTEFCQGPCFGNQDCIASYESNGIDLIVQELLLVELNNASLSKQALKAKEELFVSIRRYAAIMLLSAMESRPEHDHEIHDRILLSMQPELLIETITKLYAASGDTRNSESKCENDECSCPSCQRDVGHTMYLLALTLSAFDEELHRNLNGDLINSYDWDKMKKGDHKNHTTDDVETAVIAKLSTKFQKDAVGFEEDDQQRLKRLSDEAAAEQQDALNYYAEQTNRIEIFRDGQFETVVFPIPPVCWYLTPSTRDSIVNDTAVDNEESKVPDFFARSLTLQDEMKWQKKLTSAKFFHVVTVKISIWQEIGTVSSWLQNVLVAACYPFDSDDEVVRNESICRNINPSMRTSVITWMVTATPLATTRIRARGHLRGSTGAPTSVPPQPSSVTSRDSL